MSEEDDHVEVPSEDGVLGVWVARKPIRLPKPRGKGRAKKPQGLSKGETPHEYNRVFSAPIAHTGLPVPNPSPLVGYDSMTKQSQKRVLASFPEWSSDVKEKKKAAKKEEGGNGWD